VEHSVIYIHTKGSFNWRNGSQEELRRASTAAVTSEFCLRSLEEHENKSFPSTSSRQCNACGLLFQPLPGLHFPGNFFSAKCSYISQLLTPRKFNGRAGYLKRGDLVLRASGTKQGNFYGWSPGSVGFARYANERKYPRGQSPKWTQEEYPYRVQGFVYKRSIVGISLTFCCAPSFRFCNDIYLLVKDWVGSHPSLVPCDVGTSASLSHWRKPADYDSEFAWSLAPRAPFTHPDWDWPLKLRAMIHGSLNSSASNELLQQYFLLRGLVYRWKYFYGKIADENSWVWHWYPDGERMLSEGLSKLELRTWFRPRPWFGPRPFCIYEFVRTPM
jgi:hypothetical protein